MLKLRMRQLEHEVIGNMQIIFLFSPQSNHELLQRLAKRSNLCVGECGGKARLETRPINKCLLAVFTVS